MEQCFLCSNQIVVCVKYLEKTVEIEGASAALITARQCFFDRILWCLARLKSAVKSANDHVMSVGDQPENFITLLDSILNILTEFIDDNNKNVTNVADKKAELMMESRQVRGIIDQLLSHSLSFANIALASDKIPITTLSQSVLKVSIEFQEEFSLSQPGKKSNASDQRMKAIELENALYNLENYINDALLRLVFQVFSDMDQNPIEKLRMQKDPLALENDVEKFDLLIDRLIQIGHFSTWFSKDDPKVASSIKSCLASIESLDSYLIPAITGGQDPSLDVLQQHFIEEVKNLQHHVQLIIDTCAFSASLIEQLSRVIEDIKNNFDKSLLMDMVNRSNILLHHFQINSENLELSKDKVTKFYFSDFKLILTECDAILNFPEAIDDEKRRVIKRFRVLLSTLRKLQNAIKIKQKRSAMISGNEKPEDGNLLGTKEFPSKCSDYFNTIRPSALGSILYESKRNKKNKQNDTKFNISTLKRSKKKRNSLRIAIFKTQHEREMEAEFAADEKINESMDLQITEILEKLTDLSTTLKNK